MTETARPAGRRHPVRGPAAPDPQSAGGAYLTPAGARPCHSRMDSPIRGFPTSFRVQAQFQGDLTSFRVQVPPHRKTPAAPEDPTTRLVLGLPVSDPVSAYPAPGQAQVALLLTGQIKSPGTIGSGRTRIRSRAMVTIAPDSRSSATVVRATQQMWRAHANVRGQAGISEAAGTLT